MLISLIVILMEAKRRSWWCIGLPHHCDATEHLASPHLLPDLQNEITLYLDWFPTVPVLL